VRRGAFVRPSLAPFFWRSLLDVVGDRDVREDVLADPRWPAHLHVDLLPEGRGRGLGRALMDTWLARLRERRSPGLHAGTFAENGNALRFFASCGFTRHGDPRRMPGFRTRAGERMHVQWLVRSL
jgi:GNAT superfamily N-acetyltransferase